MSDRKIDWSKTALLVIDMQRAFVEPDQPLCVAGAAATVPVLTITVNNARKKRLPHCLDQTGIQG